MKNQYDHVIKCALFDAHNSCLSHRLAIRFVDEVLLDNPIGGNIGIDFKVKKIEYPNVKVALSLFFCNEDKHLNLHTSFNKTQPILIIDAAQLNIKKDTQLYSSINRYVANQQKIIVAVDTTGTSISKQELQALKQKFQGAEIHEINCSTGEGIDQLFDNVVKKHVPEISSAIKLSPAQIELANLKLTTFKKELKVFLDNEIIRLGDESDKCNQFKALKEENIEKYDFNKTMEYANSIKSVALIRRLPEDTSILHKLASGIAEFLSQYLSLFQTTGKSNYDKIVGRYTDLVTAQKDNNSQLSL